MYCIFWQCSAYTPLAWAFIDAIKLGLNKLNSYFPIDIDSNYSFYKPYLLAILLDPRSNLETLKGQANISKETLQRLLQDLTIEYQR